MAHVLHRRVYKASLPSPMSIRDIDPLPGNLLGEGDVIPFRDVMRHKHSVETP